LWLSEIEQEIEQSMGARIFHLLHRAFDNLLQPERVGALSRRSIRQNLQVRGQERRRGRRHTLSVSNGSQLARPNPYQVGQGCHQVLAIECRGEQVLFACGFSD